MRRSAPQTKLAVVIQSRQKPLNPSVLRRSPRAAQWDRTVATDIEPKGWQDVGSHGTNTLSPSCCLASDVTWTNFSRTDENTNLKLLRLADFPPLPCKICMTQVESTTKTDHLKLRANSSPSVSTTPRWLLWTAHMAYGTKRSSDLFELVSICV